ncbi:MAG TPA: VWA domain-containing protein, partial [Polyangiaceae bacterium]|nr:VWA domain-containing protein [Polyangiaceae bacterium]
KDTLKRLTSGVIPPGTPFALRVFGRGKDSCQTDLDIPLQPLDAGAASARIGALSAKNNAKTPIGAALGSVAEDLGSASGDRVVVLVTDGEETCNGDPAAEILKLRQKGVDVRVNIVGFAVDDAKLASTFRVWSKAGDGSYFDARDAAGLTRALTLALAPAYDVVDGSDHVVASGVVGGEPARVMPGDYTVRIKGASGRKGPVSVRSKQTSTVGL